MSTLPFINVKQATSGQEKDKASVFGKGALNLARQISLSSTLPSISGIKGVETRSKTRFKTINSKSIPSLDSADSTSDSDAGPVAPLPKKTKVKQIEALGKLNSPVNLKDKAIENKTMHNMTSKLLGGTNKTSAAAEIYRMKQKFKDKKKFGNTNISRIEERLKEDPCNANIMFELGSALSKTKHLKRSLSLLEKAQELSTNVNYNSETILEPLDLWYTLGEVRQTLWRRGGHVDLELLKKCADAFRHALEDGDRYSQNPGLLIKLHHAYKNMGDMESALRILNRLFESCPGCMQINACLISGASIYKKIGKLDLAIASITQEVIEKPPRGFKPWHITFTLARLQQLRYEQLRDSDSSKNDVNETSSKKTTLKAVRSLAQATLLKSFKLYRSSEIETLKRESSELQGTYNVLLKKMRQTGETLTLSKREALIKAISECKKKFKEVQESLYNVGENGDEKLRDLGYGIKVEKIPKNSGPPSIKGMWSAVLGAGKQTSELRQRMLAELDLDGDGKVSRIEMMQYLRKKTKEAKAEVKRKKEIAKRKANAVKEKAKQAAKAKAKKLKAAAAEQAKAAKVKATKRVQEAKQKAKTLKTQLAQSALKSTGKLYECEKDCGFKGSYDACCAHEEVCTGEPWNPDNEEAAEKLYECEKDCGFKGSYDACCAHEEVCTGEPWNPDNEEHVDIDEKNQETETTESAPRKRTPKLSISQMSPKQLNKVTTEWIGKSKTWLEVASAFDKQDEFLFACDYYMAAIVIDADNFQEWKLLAVSFYRNSSLKLALAALNNAIGLDPNNYDYKYLSNVWQGLPPPKLPPKSALTVKDVEHLSIVQLQEELRARGMPFKGDTNTLRPRLRRRVEKEDYVERRRFLDFRKKQLVKSRQEAEASIKIQAIARGRRSQKRLKALRRQAAFTKKKQGVITLQAMYRGSVGRAIYQGKLLVEKTRLEADVNAAVNAWDHYSLCILLFDAEREFGMGVKLSREVFVNAKKVMLQMREELRQSGKDVEAVEAEYLRQRDEAQYTEKVTHDNLTWENPGQYSKKEYNQQQDQHNEYNEEYDHKKTHHQEYNEEYYQQQSHHQEYNEEYDQQQSHHPDYNQGYAQDAENEANHYVDQPQQW